MNIHTPQDRNAILNLLRPEMCDQSLECMIALAYWMGATEMLEGEVLEFGSAIGKSAIPMRCFTNKPLHVYDSFKGLPPKRPEDGDSPLFYEGRFADNSPEVIIRRFKEHGLQPPIIHAGFFENLKPEDIPDKVSFVHFDGDFYSGTLAALKLVYPCMVPGAMWISHDYNYSDLPGVKRAMNEFLADKPERCSLSITCDQGAFAKLP